MQYSKLFLATLTILGVTSMTHTTPTFKITPRTNIKTPKVVTKPKSYTQPKTSKQTTKASSTKNNANKSLNSNNKTYSKSETNSIFNKNKLSDVYQNQYRRQSIINNPWLWMHMINHNRISKTKNDDNYLNGYKLGVKYATLDKKNKTTKNKNPKSNKKLKKSDLNKKQFLKGYTDGYNDTSKIK